MNKFLFLIIVVVAAAATTSQAFAQQTPPPLEKSTPTTEEPESQPQSFGKITIQISQTEQIVIDLPLKSGNKYEVVPIK